MQNLRIFVNWESSTANILSSVVLAIIRYFGPAQDMRADNNCNVAETRFENGLTVLTDRMDGVRSATLSFLYRVGARCESAEWNGVSHFIEHAVFKGTRRRSTLDIAIEQDRLGGNFDAFTTHEETGFVMKVVDEKIEKAFDLMSDMLSEPRFLAQDLEAEQNVIIEEMKMTEDVPEEQLGEIFNAALFPDNGLGKPITGTAESVRTFNAERTREYFERTFTPENLIITAAGNVDHEKIVELSKNIFGSRERGTAGESLKFAKPVAATPFVVKHRGDLEQAHFVIATPFPSASDGRRYAADLLANIIGGGTSSRIWQSIREERGLAYNVGSAATLYRDFGVFALFAATSPEQTREAIELSIAELRSILREGVTADELELAKDTARASILLSLEDSLSRAAAATSHELTFGRQISVEETLENIEQVTTDQLHDLAHEFFRTENVAFAALGDLKGQGLERGQLALS